MMTTLFISLAIIAVAAFFGFRRRSNRDEEIGKLKAEAEGRETIDDIRRRLRDVDAKRVRDSEK